MAYYIKTYSEYDSKEGHNRLRAHLLPGQTTPEGEELNDTLHISCSREIREKYPEGTVFKTSAVHDMGSYYRISDMEAVFCGSNIFNGKLYDEYKEIMTTGGAEETVFTDLFGTETGKTITEKAKPAKAKIEDIADEGPSLMEKIARDPKYRVPTIEKDGFYVDEERWRDIVRNIIKKKNTLLTGPTGTGKTKIVTVAAKRLGLPVHWYDMGITKDPVVTLIGSHRLIDGKSKFDFADFVEQIQKPGIILLDELSRATPMALNILFPCFDFRRSLRVDMAGSFETREIPVHPECVFFATANLGDSYTGVVDEIDEALKNRFTVMEMAAIPQDQEVILLQKSFGISIPDANNIVKCANAIRKLKRSDELSFGLSTRDTQEIAEMVSDGYTLRQALEKRILPIFEGTDDSGERGTVKKIIMSY